MGIRAGVRIADKLRGVGLYGTVQMTTGGEHGEAQVTALLDPGRAVIGDDRLPEVCDVVIIGGGIVGCSTSYFLARRGLRVALFEKGRIACEQSGRNWGWVRQQGRAAAELPMMMRSNAIWRAWREELGEDTGFTQGGCLYLAPSDEVLERHAAWLGVAEAHGLESRIVRGAELDGILAGGGRWAGALYTPSDGRAEPNRATPAIARAAARLGAGVFEHCAVRGVESEAGKVAAVVTERGRVRTASVVCAAGAWTSMFARSLGITVPQLRIKGTVVRTAPAAEITRGTAWAPEVAIRRRLDGGYTVAHGSLLEHSLVPASLRFGFRFVPAFRQDRNAIRLRLDGEFIRELGYPRRWSLAESTVFERRRVLDPAPSDAIVGKIRAALTTSFPEIAAAHFAETWAGVIEVSPDLIPILGPVESLPGFYIATGFSGHGFGLGPGAGECMAKLASGADTGLDLKAFRLGRYFDGSRLEPGPTV